MAHAIATYLHSKGHDVTVMLNKGIEPYKYEGIKVIPRNSGMIREADAVFCQLDTTKEAFLKASGPVFWCMHNTFEFPTVKENPSVNVIYNSEAAVSMMGWENDYIVLPPPVDIKYYDVEREGEYITLINCNENKGGKIFHEIAKRMPNHRFLSVIGAYGTQFISIDISPVKINIDNAPVIQGIGDLPNVDIMNNQKDIREVYKRSRILLMPSLYESWGKVATEAMCSGIPVIASPTFGLKENLGKNGIFVERENIEGWVEAISKLDGKKEYLEASIHSKKRAKELDSKEKLEQLEAFVSKKVSEHKRKREYGIQQHS
jgi:glycosyltransferase involved in cell wall biosynthesis